MIHSIDEKDRKILEILQENSNLSSYKISKKVLIPVTTVNNRIKKLKKLGVIRKFTVDVDKGKLGFTISGYIFVAISLEELKSANMKVRDLMAIVRKHPLVDYADNITGDLDMIIRLHAEDIKVLNDYVVNTLSSLKGVEKTRTAIVLEHR
jgi:DNA-binding Lrp family transcriptional regulator